ncbi:MAG TPA: hypothetical protein VK501_03715 [Baekduia sp.]|uniref:hypothetical protein n=1 Tax=Baekduia sp. TaxID=2600305 RepID=UPI002B6D63BB|nr:hypothetical protein [Baekduia sp.]HMJ33002.1 hypothetical protein [Baekduia sp.]
MRGQRLSAALGSLILGLLIASAVTTGLVAGGALAIAIGVAGFGLAELAATALERRKHRS